MLGITSGASEPLFKGCFSQPEQRPSLVGGLRGEARAFVAFLAARCDSPCCFCPWVVRTCVVLLLASLVVLVMICYLLTVADGNVSITFTMRVMLARDARSNGV